ncbi:MAG: acetylglutamate kinase [Ignavibacteriales bacterium]|nr:acetylglutamate kinase [Ignavibacteriales bacterium]
MTSIAQKTEVLIQALPYIQRYEQKTFVIKYGGAAMIDDELKQSFAQDVTLLKKIGINIVIVHGGGKEVTELSSRLGIQSTFIDGQRYTDDATMEIVQMVLAGKTNKEIVARINQMGGGAVGLSGIDADLLRVKKYSEGNTDLGWVGEVTSVNSDYLNLMLRNGLMPVVAPVGVGVEGHSYNINADIAAANIAEALQAEKLVYLSDVKGVMDGEALVPTILEEEAMSFVERGVISGGMIPKVRSAFAALQSGVNKVHMIDGRVPHSLLLEIFTDEGVGTELVHGKKS